MTSILKKKTFRLSSLLHRKKTHRLSTSPQSLPVMARLIAHLEERGVRAHAHTNTHKDARSENSNLSLVSILSFVFATFSIPSSALAVDWSDRSSTNALTTFSRMPLCLFLCFRLFFCVFSLTSLTQPFSQVGFPSCSRFSDRASSFFFLSLTEPSRTRVDETFATEGIMRISGSFEKINKLKEQLLQGKRA